MEAGAVGAAVESAAGNIYTGVCIDTACTLGICTERNALFNMITHDENKIMRVLAVRTDGKVLLHAAHVVNLWRSSCRKHTARSKS